jgi:hypothetical protein
MHYRVVRPFTCQARRRRTVPTSMNKCQEKRLRVVSRIPVRRGHRLLSGRGTGEGVAVQRSGIGAGVAGWLT